MTGTFVRSWIEREELASTSDLARALVAGPGLAYPILVRALRQTRGRGRGANAWWSDDGSLTFTLALDPAAQRLRAEHQPRVALAVAVAIVDAVTPLLADPSTLGIRWPNDVEAGGRKL
ncbi:MAG: biotin--[acetyl-CoA-carboxylase] ligase, partial [Thermoleophilia bacterium]|nr:biotin--[acetyl-CoA-carboxylase] ligase [Thermoleophilia bacterium]